MGSQDRPQVALAVDQHPVDAFGPDCPYPAFAITIRPRPQRRLHDPYTLADEEIIERGSELGVAAPDEEPEGAELISKMHDQVAGLLGSPSPVRVPNHPEDVHP